MALDKSLKKVMIIGSGPIVIGQAAEFDYAGTQACRVLREDGIEIVLVNSNPATIMTDTNIADKIYIEPLTLDTVKRIAEIEKPDGILSGLGGQTGLTLSMKLAKEGFLDKHGIKLLGSSPETIDKAEDRLMFKELMLEIGQPVIPSRIANNLQECLDAADELNYPVVVRPAFTLGGTGGGIAADRMELEKIASTGLMLSPISQVLIEKSIKGWKEVEFEVMRDKDGSVFTICPMENFDPVGVHTGDSIVIAPTMTLADREVQMLRTASLEIVTALGVEGGCNVQLALNPHSFEYAVIEVNPRVSRSSALASKATGYPIARVSTKIAIGYNLDEIINYVTGTTYASFEPTLDYVAIKFPKWPFDKFVYADKTLGTQMKATGEVMALGANFEETILKAVRGAELGLTDLNLPRLADKTTERLLELLEVTTDQRIFIVYEAIKRGITLEKLHDITKIDMWFLNGLNNIHKNPRYMDNSRLVYKMVDTCAGEFEAQTPYFYSIQDGTENEALPFIEKSMVAGKERIIVLGSGPIRIGQGIEFDYAGVHCVWTLRKMGYEVIVINNNPETLSTDFETADRLYFEPLYLDDVMNIINIEKPMGVVVSFGGGTAIKLTKQLAERGVNIIGMSADAIDICEDRDRFDHFLEKLDIKRPQGGGVFTAKEALTIADKLGYPVVMRPSYVLGGQNMIVAHNAEDIAEYMDVILASEQTNPILIDKYLKGIEIEVDAICDGTDILIPGIMEHIESSGVHSGDSISVYPTKNVGPALAKKLHDMSKKICLALDVHGLINIQYVLFQGEPYVIEVNPRASRTVPYLSKVTGIPMCELATKTAMGVKLSELGYGTGVGPIPDHFTVKVPVFSFQKLTDLDVHLGPEMKSTGEVLGIGRDLEEALYKGLVAAGYKMEQSGGVIITVRDGDKEAILPVARKFADQGFALYATAGTATHLRVNGIATTAINKISENAENNISTLLEEPGKVSYIISTSNDGRNPAKDSTKIRRKASMLGVTTLTSIDTANALADSLASGYNQLTTEIVDITKLKTAFSA